MLEMRLGAVPPVSIDTAPYMLWQQAWGRNSPCRQKISSMRRCANLVSCLRPGEGITC